jgi:hypothetical protein
MKFDVQSNIAKVMGQLSELPAKQAPYATALGLTRTAQKIREAQQETMKRSLDRPTKWTLNSVRVQPAKKSDPTPSAVVFIGDESAQRLLPQVEGTKRGGKAAEGMLRGRGLMPAGSYAVPASGMRLDSHGNVSRAALAKVVDGLRPGGDYFAGRIGRPGTGGQEGIWQRKGSKVQPAFLFVQGAPQYRQRYDFKGTAATVAGKELDKQLRAALEEALTTQR